jgi:pimeloyl-ACP methyl ester carboxylesterase
MKAISHVFVVLSVLSPTLGPNVFANKQGETQPLELSKMGLMFVGGREVEMPGGGRFGGGGKQTQIAGQALVHYLIPPTEKREGKLPVIMVPGMGLTSYLYLSTPDGRDGWAQIFVRAGYPVYVFDEPYNAISGFEVGKFNEVKAGTADVSELPNIMLWANEITWRRWGIGPEPGVPAENTRFPVEHIAQFHASMTPVISGGGGRGAAAGGSFAGRRGGRAGGATESTPAGGRGRGGRGAAFGNPAGDENGVVSSGNPKVDALIGLLEKVGPATLILHSASGPTGFETTRLRPDLVKAIVAVEVTGSPTDPEDIAEHFADKRFIGVYGDHFDLRPMQGRYEASVKMAEEINAAGGKADVIWLPKLGIEGNSHLLMQDNNNDEIARMIIEHLQP